MKIIERKAYLEKLWSFKDTRLVKVVTGVRRCGKSTLLQSFQKQLLASGIPQQSVVYLNFEDMDNAALKDIHKLKNYLDETIDNRRRNYLFFDEIQLVKDFPVLINSLLLDEKLDIYITGSNADMLSSDIATLLTGRYIEMEILPFSFHEYLIATNTKTLDSAGLETAYNKYLKTSSFPYAVSIRDQAVLDEYLEGIYKTIVEKDITQRFNIADKMMLESVAAFAFSTVGNLVSTKKIADTMISNGRKIDTKTVEKYLSALKNAFVLYSIGRFDMRGKQHLRTGDKYYTVDIGLRRALLGETEFNAGATLENIIFLELHRRGGRIAVGKSDTGEVDFVRETKQGLEYYQVSVSTREPATLQRELASLQATKDNYPKYLLTLDNDPNSSYDGVLRLNALEWLAND
jgi:predicted AAA+ superfamily ATPase